GSRSRCGSTGGATTRCSTTRTAPRPSGSTSRLKTAAADRLTCQETSAGRAASQLARPGTGHRAPAGTAAPDDNGEVPLRIDITGLRPERVPSAASPLAELTAMLHALTATEHHPDLTAWAAGVRAGLRPELAERICEAEFLWRSSRAEFLLPAQPRETLTQELDDVDRIADEAYVASALVTSCGSSRGHFGGPSSLTDTAARERALDQAQAPGALQEAFAGQLLADPRAVRARVRETLEQCAEAFFNMAWPGVAGRIAADLRVKTDLRDRQGL